jgi:hypothetical protein
MTADEYEQLPPEEKEHFGELGDNPRNACNTWQLQGNCRYRQSRSALANVLAFWFDNLGGVWLETRSVTI